jgi:hypothetical protein
MGLVPGEVVSRATPSLLLSLNTSPLVIPIQEEEWSACAVASLCRDDDAQRKDGGREVEEGSIVHRRHAPRAAVVVPVVAYLPDDTTQKATLFVSSGQ